MTFEADCVIAYNLVTNLIFNNTTIANVRQTPLKFRTKESIID
jgi:hypothetical protein